MMIPVFCPEDPARSSRPCGPGEAKDTHCRADLPREGEFYRSRWGSPNKCRCSPSERRRRKTAHFVNHYAGSTMGDQGRTIPGGRGPGEAPAPRLVVRGRSD